MFDAVENEDIDQLKEVLARGHADPNARDSEHRVPVLSALARELNRATTLKQLVTGVDMARVLLDAKADADENGAGAFSATIHNRVSLSFLGLFLNGALCSCLITSEKAGLPV